MERMPATANEPKPPVITSQTVAGLLGVNATRHVLYLLEGQYLYQSQAEDGSIRYKFLSAQSVRLAFSREPVDSGWLSPEICRWGYSQAGQWAIMFIPPAVHTLWLPASLIARKGDNPLQTQTEAPELNEGFAVMKVPLPALVFAGVGQHYYLWAVNSKTFDPQLIPYLAPLPNVYTDGRICWGSNQVSLATPQNLKETWQLFISSPFNSHLVQGKSKLYKTDILVRLGKLAASHRKTYPASDLIPLTGAGTTQNDFGTLNRLVEQFIASMQRDRPGM